MKKFLTIILILAIGGLSFYFFNRPIAPVVHNPKIAVTIFPLADIAKNIFGSQIEVVQILPTNSSEHTFELTPEQALKLQNVDLLFQIGQGLDENWAAQVTRGNSNIKIVPVSLGINLLTSNDADEPGNDPHYWLDYDNAKLIAKNMLSEAVKKYPNLDLQQIENNLSTWLQQVDQSKELSLIKIQALPAQKKNLVTFHNGWQYFAKEFNLNIVGVFEQFAGREPTPKELADLQKVIVSNGITKVYSEPQFSPEQLKALAGDLGLSIATLDPIGGGEGWESYIKMMEFNINEISK
ncbi:MAG: metal ABC transporter substrate-binding protein [Janthinobacterium sp.]|jgi:ABC-type Zn uptake system ZnuABC Zn-binding protein ZnuA